ncbi:cytochrome P450 4d1-like isoform X2 [Bradysia coprophila]|uniref:cytochrome P450 4d1-like isoform X2 n=1 Tax=Bradysia coprophila TaxID=38358 RepID=UPI00187D9C39|nr:cytochrome P450 4d1-like isoform X2 [Bradysia coprophila]
MSFVIETLFVGGILLLLLLTTNIRKIFYSLRLPGPIPLPIIGNGLLFFNKSSAENFQIVGQLVNDYGDVARIWLGPSLLAIIKNPKYLETILSSPKHIEKSGEYNYVKPWLNDGLLLSKGSKWFQRRKILTPAFHFKILEQFVEIFDAQSRILVETLAKYDQKTEVEMFPLVTLCALDVICESAMGTQINAQQNSNSDYVLAVKKIAHIIHMRMFSVLLRENFLFRFSRLYSEEKRALKTLHDFTDKVINERRNAILTNNSEHNDKKSDSVDESIGMKRKMAFLDILLQSTVNGKPLSNSDIREEVDTFMFEGHDTTTSGITFCLYCIAQYPEVQQKCFQEIRDVIGDDVTKPVTLNDLNNLNYFDLVIKETLRIFPSVPLIGRELQEEVVIGKYTLPKGTNVVIPIYYMGHDPNIFVNPEVFTPERFLVERNTEKNNPFSYIPFSAGPRNCIGQKFAVLEIKSLVSKVLRYFEISLAENSKEYPTLLAELILIPESKINFHVKPRMYS